MQLNKNFPLLVIFLSIYLFAPSLALGVSIGFSSGGPNAIPFSEYNIEPTDYESLELISCTYYMNDSLVLKLRNHGSKNLVGEIAYHAGHVGNPNSGGHGFGMAEEARVAPGQTIEVKSTHIKYDIPPECNDVFYVKVTPDIWSNSELDSMGRRPFSCDVTPPEDATFKRCNVKK